MLYKILSQFGHLVKKQEIPSKVNLLQEGKISTKFFFIEKGCLRLYFNHEGKDITFQFFFEGEVVSSIESFKTNQPSLFAIESIEPCIIYSISKRDFELLINKSLEIKEIMENQIFQRLLLYQKLFLSRIKNTPKERYQELLENSPKLLQRIPQHYIASFLGITSVSLSRIRNRK
ncbi:Crp/Fnr family transcriptional regulator [Bernardetia sp. MNP-M8]|uniref:Crp/Fnr family transcriptional regulator n=1 Tax=Bernardetia sp. MNP-M8 TaxID=3127470 RepID=UPI0030D15FEC